MKEAILILDRSGSMSSTKDDAIGGVNEFLEQKKGENISFTLIQFDDHYEVVHENTPIAQVPPLTGATYVPRGTTALFDAIGRTITDVGQRLSNLPEVNRPEKVVVGILTDGHENASVKFSKAKIKEMIDHQTTHYAWEFVFMAQNYEAFADAHAGGAQNFGAGLSIGVNNSSNVKNMRVATSMYFSARV